MKPLPLFDSMKFIGDVESVPSLLYPDDYLRALEFLKSYTGSQGTFNSYRRDIERLLHWSQLIAKKSIVDLKRSDIEEFIQFCQKPPKSWIGIYKVPRFVDQNGQRVPNTQWRPFITTITKSDYRKGNRAEVKNFAISFSAVKDMFAILGSFYNFLLQEEYVHSNPVALIRQKSKFIRKNQSQPRIRRLSGKQWQYVMDTAHEMASVSPDLHERTLFIMSILYSMYLRISELVATARWTPCMNHFFRDNEERWWFITVGKGNKKRQIAVSDAMLEILKRWRRYLGLSALPSPADTSFLLPKIKGQGAITSTTYIRKIVQDCFDQAIHNLRNDALIEESESLVAATVHWLRHTGISDDVKHRPREHVRDDAGHGSGAITDKYIDVELKERHRSARGKLIV